MPGVPRATRVLQIGYIQFEHEWVTRMDVSGTASSRTPEPRCPRCGYDQRGVVMTWTESCPLDGICSECGYHFEWADVMRPDRTRLRRFFEHERGLWRSWISALVTLAWAMAPWAFWSRVRLHHEPKPRRMLLWLIVAVASIWTVIAVARLGTFALETFYLGGPARNLSEGIGNSLAFPVFLVGWGPGTNLKLPFGTFSMPPIECLVLEWSPLYFGLFAQAILLPLLLLILPETRRRAKVRPAHVLRAGVYGQSWIFFHLLFLLSTAFDGLLAFDWDVSIGMSGPLLGWLDHFRVVYALFLAGWIAAWWWFALARGFRIERPTLHWLVLMVAAVLGLMIFALGDWDIATRLFF